MAKHRSIPIGLAAKRVARRIVAQIRFHLDDGSTADAPETSSNQPVAEQERRDDISGRFKEGPGQWFELAFMRKAPTFCLCSIHLGFSLWRSRKKVSQASAIDSSSQGEHAFADGFVHRET
jgi:hypothetical protein